MNSNKKYVKKDQIQHLLDRCEMYIGSNKLRKYEDYVGVKDEENNYKIIKKDITSSPAILRIFVEILSNAIDNNSRSKSTKTPCTTIKVNIDKETGETKVFNDGDSIPIEIHEKEGIYNHSLIFGQLLTSSNYDDTQSRDVSGVFGVGSKSTNIFSSQFTVKGLDPANKKTFQQTFTNNMRTSSEPIVKPTKLTKGYTEITYFPEFKRFGLEGYTDDIISLYLRYVLDAAMLTKVKVYFNDELLPVNSLVTYSKLYDSPTEEHLVLTSDKYEVVVTPAEEFQAIPFVNGVFTRLGGIHVEQFSEAIFRPIVDKLNKKPAEKDKKDKKASATPQINIKDVKNFFRIFIVCTVPNPEFSSQDKERLENPKIANVEVNVKDINKLMKWSVIDDIKDVIKSKEMLVMKKTEKKTRGYTKIDGYDPANNAGGKNSHLCSLILCEGLSAKTYAVAGISKGVYDRAGRDWYGILPLRGKCVAPDTPILLWNGEIKKAKCIEIGDVLVNDNGEATTVLELFSGTDTMYEVQQLKGDNYTVNSEHTLTLKVSGHCSITWLDKKNCWNMEYFDRGSMKIKNKQIFCSNDDAEQEICEVFDCKDYQKSFCNRSSLTRHYNRKHKDLEYPKPKKSIVCYNSTKSKDEGYIEILEFQKTINDDNIVDIDIKEYLKLDDRVKHLLKGFKLNNYIKWDKKDVLLDPYILGMWLGDGLATGYGFTGEDIELISEWYTWAINNNAEIVHNNRDSFTIRKRGCYKRGGDEKRICIGSILSSNENCRACKDKLSFACSNDEELDTLKSKRIIKIIKDKPEQTYGSNPFKEILDKYNLVDNKHIPIDYIINNKEVRLQLLAGFIDTDGSVGEDGRIEICQSKDHKNMLDSLLLICKSLGFYCSLSDKEAFYIDKKGEKIYKEAYRLMISGNGISEIPTKLYRKQLTHVFKKDSLNTGINIVEKGFGEYVGFMTDKTHRFLLGDFTVTHNCLNVRNSTYSIIAKNAVITDLIQALGLQLDLDYTIDKNYHTLNYGKVMLLTDSDVDGLHISGLLMNFFHYLFPTLLQREEPFLVSMLTPIVRIFKKGLNGSDILFYDENRYKEYARTHPELGPRDSKYYKGLGTTKTEDVPDTFGEKMVEYVTDENVNESVNKVFHKKFADDRKTWLANFNSNPDFSLDDTGKITNMNMSTFLNTEVIKFSHDDCKRSIPNLFDGLKESQRKILYSVKKRKLTYGKTSLKVAQLGGYVAEHTNYHHGEQNLYETITKMAQEYPGTNNIPLLYRDGMFGTRLNNKDAASPRYIFTKMEQLTPLIFREEDDILLDHIVDDGDVVEPTFYIPIIPMILVNGCQSIGTGWSSTIPCYNPVDVIKCIKIWIESDGDVLIEDSEEHATISLLPEIHPWYRDFEGTIEPSGDDKYITYGVLSKDKAKVHVSELPIGMWTDKFKEMCETWANDKKIKSMKNNSTPRKVNFTLVESEDGFSCNISNMKLHSYLYTSNMVLFNEKNQLKKYSVDEIINDFCVVRYDFYKKRKRHQLDVLEKELKHLSNKARFIKEYNDGIIIIKGKEEDAIVKQLEQRKYDKENIVINEEGEEEISNKKHGYNYLLNMAIRTLTLTHVKKLKNDILSAEKKLEGIRATSEKQMWVSDLDEFLEAYDKWLKVMDNVSTGGGKKKFGLTKGKKVISK